MAGFITQDAWTVGSAPAPIHAPPKKKKPKTDTATTVITPNTKGALDGIQKEAWMQLPFTLESALVVFPQMKRPSKSEMAGIGPKLYDAVMSAARQLMVAKSDKPSWPTFRQIVVDLLKPYAHRVHSHAPEDQSLF